MKTINERRRKFVNQEVSIKLSGKKTSLSEKRKIFKNAWKEAKKKIK